MNTPIASPIAAIHSANGAPQGRAAQQLVTRLGRLLPEPEVLLSLPLLESIARLKVAHDAVVVAHDYQVPLITAGIADFVGDSLEMARYAARCEAGTIVVCGVHFMAETVKLLCPDKRVLLPNMNARCSLADSIDAQYVRGMRRSYPGLPIVAYVNTTAAVKAEADICCTSANAAAVARSLAVRRLILVPDRQLAADVERETGIEVVSSGGQCGVQARFSGKEIADYRREHRAVVLAHPGCSEETRRSANFVGSSAAMTRYLRLVRPDRVLLLGDCSMADEVKLDNPEVEFLEPCNLCIFMQAVTPPSVARVLEDGCNEIDVEPEIAQRALRAISRMLAL
jgi:quinolinate synthase